MTETTKRKRGRPSLGLGALNRTLTLKVSDQQLCDWTLRADKLGLSVSKFIRNAATFFCLMEKWDKAENETPRTDEKGEVES